MIFLSSICNGQYPIINHSFTKNDTITITYPNLSTDTIMQIHPSLNGFIYVEGIMWTENRKQDSVIDIIIEGDTMTAIRNLLIYCLQEKQENDNAFYLLNTLNLDHLSKLINSEDFNFYLKQYRTSVKKNKLKRKSKYE